MNQLRINNEVKTADWCSTSTGVEYGGSLRGLLALSCDWYWQANAEGLLEYLDGPVSNFDRAWLHTRKKKPVWEWPEIGVEGADTSQVCNAFAHRHPFANLDLTLHDKRGHPRHLSLAGEPLVSSEGAFIGFRGTAKDLTARRRVESLVAMEQAVTKSLAEAATSRKVLQAVMRVVCETERWETAGFFQVIDDKGTSRLIAGWSGPGTSAEATDYYKSTSDKVIAAGGMLSAVTATGHPRWVVDMKESQTSWAQRVRKTAERATFFSPILVDGAVNGIFAFATRAVRKPDERLLETMQRIGEQVGQYLKRKHAEQILRQSEERFRALTDLSSDCYWETDAGMRISCVEGHRERDGIGLWAQELVGKKFHRVGLKLDMEGGPQQLPWRSQVAFRDVVMCYGDGDSRRYLSVSGEPVSDLRGRFTGYRGVGRDITDRKRSEKRIRHLATHDELTGLPNRVMFGELLSKAIDTLGDGTGAIALLFIDLDRFKSINDTLGHDTGDELLMEMAKRLKQALRDQDLVARLGGDEFVVLLRKLSDSGDAVKVAKMLLNAISQPLSLSGGEYRITASIGISLADGQGIDGRSLMRNADLAMYAAKRNGKDSSHLYTPQLQSEASQRLSIERLLATALENKELFIVYQPKVDLQNDRIVGAEALLRWKSPELGWISPNVFISVAEETGLILSIGKWVLRQACLQQVAWHRQGLPELSMAVNLSARQFADEFLLGDVACALREAQMSPQHLELEITEGMAIQNVDRSVKVLNALKGMGVRIAIDDFGTGYSSLGQLKRFPIDTLKVDRSFICDLPGARADEALVSAIIRMGAALGMTTVAEGVETAAQHAFVRTAGCDQMQGFLFSKPVTAENFRRLWEVNAADAMSMH